MGNAFYEIYRNGEKINGGYGVLDVCNATEEVCERKIDRGLAYLCGETPGGDETSCGGYFCEAHLYGGLDWHGWRCRGCVERIIEAKR